MKQTRNNMEFVDRWGQKRVPAADARYMDREGAFAICVSHGRLLLCRQAVAPDVPELPGGGIDEGETAWQALCREVSEETGLSLEDVEEQSPSHEQFIGFYADNDDAFWYYRQSFYVLQGPAIDALSFEGEKPTPEGGVMRWEAIGSLGSLSVHYWHLAGMKEAFSQ